MESGGHIAKFIDQTDVSINSIKANPALYPTVNKEKQIHKCLIVKQVSHTIE